MHSVVPDECAMLHTCIIWTGTGSQILFSQASCDILSKRGDMSNLLMEIFWNISDIFGISDTCSDQAYVSMDAF